MIGKHDHIITWRNLETGKERQETYKYVGSKKLKKGGGAISDVWEDETGNYYTYGILGFWYIGNIIIN